MAMAGVPRAARMLAQARGSAPRHRIWKSRPPDAPSLDLSLLQYGPQIHMKGLSQLFSLVCTSLPSPMTYSFATLILFQSISESQQVIFCTLYNRVSHLQFFLISLLFQAGIYARHTKEQE